MKSIVLFSGGMDSTAALIWARRSGHVVSALSVDYGQRHRDELNVAARIASALDVPHRIVVASDNAFGVDSPLRHGAEYDGQAAPVLPARNVVLLSIAAGVALVEGAQAIVIGCCADDAEDFPDCRKRFLQAAQTALSLAIGRHVDVLAPWVGTRKSEIVRWCASLGEAEILAGTWSCYTPTPGGKQCGACRACALRKAALEPRTLVLRESDGPDGGVEAPVYWPRSGGAKQRAPERDEENNHG